MSTPSDPRAAVQAKYRTVFLAIGVSMLITSFVLAVLCFRSLQESWWIVVGAIIWLYVFVLSGCLFIVICSTNYDSATKTARIMRIGWIVSNCVNGPIMVRFIVYAIMACADLITDAQGNKFFIPMEFKVLLVVFMLGCVVIFVCGILVVIRLEKYVDELEKSKPAMDPEYGATAGVFVYQQNQPNMQYYDPNMQQNQPNMQYYDPTMQQNQPNMQQNQPTMQQNQPNMAQQQ